MEEVMKTVIDHETLGKVIVETCTAAEPNKVHGTIYDCNDDGTKGDVLDTFDHVCSEESFHVKLRAKKQYYTELSDVID